MHTLIPKECYLKLKHTCNGITECTWGAHTHQTLTQDITHTDIHRDTKQYIRECIHIYSV